MDRAKVLTLAHNHLLEIAQRATHNIEAARLVPYNRLPFEILMREEVLPILEIELQYLEAHDLAKLQEYIVNSITKEIRGGVPYDSLLKIGNYISTELQQFFERILGGNEAHGDIAESSRVLHGLQLRLAGLRMLVTATVTNTGYQAAHTSLDWH
jgi:hypothetical protein